MSNNSNLSNDYEKDTKNIKDNNISITDSNITSNNISIPTTSNNNPSVNATISNTTEKNPWESINDMLIHNKCWLCEQPFPRGRSKKVFQVSHLLSYYHQLYMSTILHNKEENNDISNDIDENNKNISSYLNNVSNSNGNNMNTKIQFISQNLQKCYDNYVYLISMNENKPDLLLASFQKYDIETWMSGLICGITPSCKEELVYFVESKTNNTSNKDNNDNSKKIINMSIYNNKDCPPGCGCDNPWPFLL